jgi:hypothetical protein
MNHDPQPPPPRGQPLYQIYEDDLETCEEAIQALRTLILTHGSKIDIEYADMLAAAIKRVRDDYGPHTNITIIPAD